MADCKRKTANLFDKTAESVKSTTTYNFTITGLDPNKYYTCSTNFEKNSDVASLYFGGGASGANGVWSGYAKTFQPDADGGLLVGIRYATAGTDAPAIINDVMAGTIWVMVNEGSEALPYEPYGWLHSLRKLTTATDTITTLPATLYADGTNATVGLKGNMSQTGTPTPSSPIQPSECGERTGNLIDVNASESGGISDTGVLIDNPNTWRSTVYYDIDTTLNYVASKAKQTIRINYYDASKNHISREGVTQETYRQLTIPSNARYFKWTLYDNAGIPDIQAARSIKPMVNVGSSPLPYEPYGYKLTISSANTTTPVYLGNVESTRQIKKYEFTGQEADLRMQLVITATNAVQAPTTISDYKREPFICSHMEVTSSSGASSTHGFYGQELTLCFDLAMGLDTLEKVRTYLQQQYAAGTPVTVWYVLSSATTGVVNEPIRKIGTYADEVSNISTPTITGKDSFDVETTLKPSEVELTYTGWHDASVKEKSRNLFDATIEQGTITIDGDLAADNRIRTKEYIDIDSDYITLSWGSGQATETYIMMYDENGDVVRMEGWATSPMTKRIPSNVKKIRIIWRYTSQADILPSAVNSIMLVSGQSPLSYEPYWK